MLSPSTVFFANSNNPTNSLEKIPEAKYNIEQSTFSSMINNVSNSNQNIDNESTPSIFIQPNAVDKQKNILNSAKTSCKKIASSAYHYLRSIDGIDEFTGATGQILPQFQQALLSLGILLPAIPLVGIGAKGAIDESIENFQDIYPSFIKEIKEKKQEILKALQQINVANNIDKKLIEREVEQFFDAWIDWLQGENQQENSEHIQQMCAAWKYLQEQDYCTAKIRYITNEYQRIKQELPAVRIERNSSPLQAAAMSLMTAGMVGLSAKSIADLLLSQGIQAAEVASDSAAMVSNILLLPAQIMMTTYGISQTIAGYKRDKLLQENRTLLENNQQQEIIKENIAQLKEIADRKIHYNSKQRLEYGVVTAIGQSAMALSSLSAMTGVGAPVGFVPAVIGAPATIYGAFIRIRSKVQEVKFLGAKEAKNSSDKRLNFDELTKNIAKKTATDTNQATPSTTTTNTLNTIVKVATNTMLQQQKILAEAKLLSIILEILNKAYQNETLLTAQTLHKKVFDKVNQLFDRVEKSQKRFIEQPNKHFIRQSTSLLLDDLKIIKDMLTLGEYRVDYLEIKLINQQGYYDLIPRLEQIQKEHKILLSTTTKEKILKSCAHDFLQLTTENKTIKEALQHQDGTSNKLFSWNDLQQLIQLDKQAKAIYTQHYNHYVIKQIKNEAKFLRDNAYEHIINGLATESTSEQNTNKSV
ncbi:hypothetical protein QE197_03220 [Arsenophonus nasoniae]|uniref:Uncharacterized protein n=1 Tax=Arsenophonus nasoniae TaxID=638 RepID=D2TZ66_9GAMM|nr:hypothetical protein [Arsenophonus nasoniae]QBY42308.1 hypothetical protein ArsFIN_08530 [Arsenophonus nasoniae]WGM02265.1 hypothetical protein QE210_03945 [Arsenophonus nasoniae]WGM06447.1 hypothetical protein QE258_03655 [Arsenophonus nasoniae]WGM11384.1 hypothetical protein QE197_03220 [Arsenophonus nasoniae]WGM16080.1 hypothetical protein QE193_03185 [Arsenophonus nasoniae]